MFELKVAQPLYSLNDIYFIVKASQLMVGYSINYVNQATKEIPSSAGNPI